MNEYRIARFLGWFSLGLGAVELLMPKTVCRALDVDCDETLVQAFGAREMAAGLGILSQRNPGPWLWGRVAGDAVDLSALAAALRVSGRRAMVGAALASVAGITALDIVCGLRISSRRALSAA
ncbi:MAG TPA: hypothetical protein VH417_01585 [Vicinamibacterales bacterium]|jgi:hypothetical protein